MGRHALRVNRYKNCDQKPLVSNTHYKSINRNWLTTKITKMNITGEIII